MSDHVLTVEELFARLRLARLEHVAGRPPGSRGVTGVVGVDEFRGGAADGRDEVAGVLVLGIGLENAEAVRRAWQRWDDLGAAALVVRAGLLQAQPVDLPAEGLTLVGVGEEMAWMRLAAMVAADLDRAHAPGVVDDLDPVGLAGAGDDFYAIANSLSALVGGPVTIEDLSSRILAFSADQDRADEHRQRSVLERRVSRAHNDALERAGVFERLYDSASPIHFSPDIEGARPRAAMRIRYGEESLGSIWAVMDDEPTPTQAQGLVEASNVIALSITRRRLLDDARREERGRRLTRLLEGGRDGAESAAELGIAGVPAYVMAMGLARPEADEVADELRARALGALVASFVTSVSPRSVVAALGRTIYAVVPHSGSSASDPSCHAAQARRFATNLLQRLAGSELVFGIGDLTADAAQLSRSRRQADAAARVLRHRARAQARRAVEDAPDQAVGYWRDLQSESLLLEVTDTMIARNETVAWPLDRLCGEHGEEQLATVRAYLDHFGDVGAAAADVYVHPNTFRYRLRRLAERESIDLDDPDVRFALMLQLRLLDNHRGLTQDTGLPEVIPAPTPGPARRDHDVQEVAT